MNKHCDMAVDLTIRISTAGDTDGIRLLNEEFWRYNAKL